MLRLVFCLVHLTLTDQGIGQSVARYFAVCANVFDLVVYLGWKFFHLAEKTPAPCEVFVYPATSPVTENHVPKLHAHICP